jgi:hypothetical protein
MEALSTRLLNIIGWSPNEGGITEVLKDVEENTVCLTLGEQFA